MLQFRKLPGNAGGGLDGTAGFNVHSIAIEVPISELTQDGTVPTDATDPSAVIGFWSTASRPFVSITPPTGGAPQSVPFVGLDRPIQVSRLGNPLVNEVVIPLQDKDKFNASHPSNDGQFLNYVTSPELAALFTAVHGISVPPAPRNDLVAVFLTGVAGLNQPPNVVASEELRLNVAIPPTAPDLTSRLGVLGGDLAGYPNGRRVGDDVVDIALQAVAGVLVGGAFAGSPNADLGDGVDHNDVPYLPIFPYLGTPHDGKADTISFAVTIDGSQEVPPVATTARGTGYVEIDTAANTLRYWVEFGGVADVAAHIHGFSERGSNSGVEHSLLPGPGSPKMGVWNYDESDEAMILGGLTYFNIHSAANPGGEIRGQIEPISRRTINFTAALDGAQEVPPVATTATGTASVTLDLNANTLSYRVDFTGVVDVAAHIHGFSGRGANSGVKHSLLPGPGTPKVGVWNYNQADEASILAGDTYFNIHSAANPGGEIRGQIEPFGP